jgi:hypothetical protein
MSKKPAKYRPGIDDPPPSRLVWITGLFGLGAVAAFAAAIFKKLRRK